MSANAPSQPQRHQTLAEPKAALPPIQQQMERQDHAIGNIISLINDLERKLEVVMGQPPPRNEAPQKEAPPAVRLSGQLEANNQMLDIQASRLREIYERLEV